MAVLLEVSNMLAYPYKSNQLWPRKATLSETIHKLLKGQLIFLETDVIVGQRLTSYDETVKFRFYQKQFSK